LSGYSIEKVKYLRRIRALSLESVWFKVQSTSRYSFIDSIQSFSIKVIQKKKCSWDNFLHKILFCEWKAKDLEAEAISLRVRAAHKNQTGRPNSGRTIAPVISIPHPRRILSPR
jgi:hypothetical protein